MPPANLLVAPEQLEAPDTVHIIMRLGQIGIVAYVVPVVGNGGPELELDGTSFFGKDEIDAGIDAFTSTQP